MAVLERANRSWLVRERSWQPKPLCACVCVSLYVVRACAVSVLSPQTAGKEGKRGQCQ